MHAGETVPNKIQCECTKFPHLPLERTVRLGVNRTIDFRLWIAILSVKI